MTESIIGLYKTKIIRPNGPWRSLEAVEYATLEWVDWFNNRWLLGPIGDIPPVEFEKAYHGSVETPAVAAGLNRKGLRESRGGSVSLVVGPEPHGMIRPEMTAGLPGKLIPPAVHSVGLKKLLFPKVFGMHHFDPVAWIPTMRSGGDV